MREFVLFVSLTAAMHSLWAAPDSAARSFTAARFPDGRRSGAALFKTLLHLVNELIVSSSTSFSPRGSANSDIAHQPSEYQPRHRSCKSQPCIPQSKELTGASGLFFFLLTLCDNSHRPSLHLHNIYFQHRKKGGGPLSEDDTPPFVTVWRIFAFLNWTITPHYSRYLKARLMH